MKSPEEKFGSLRRRLDKRLQKPIGHHDGAAQDARPQMELHAPDPETHGQGARAIEGETPEQGRLCPACNSPAHAHDTKCPWCGAALAPALP